MLQQLVHVLCLFLVISIAACALPGSTLFSWHPTLMALAFLGLMAEGVLTSISFRSVEAGQKRVSKIQTHMYWQLAALAAVSGGLIAIVSNKASRGC